MWLYTIPLIFVAIMAGGYVTGLLLGEGFGLVASWIGGILFDVFAIALIIGPRSRRK